MKIRSKSVQLTELSKTGQNVRKLDDWQRCMLRIRANLRNQF